MIVIIVEDNDSVCELWRTLLAGVADIDAARTLGEGLNKLAKQEYDAALLDLGLPCTGNPLETLAIWAAAPNRPPTVVCTGFSDPLIKQKCDGHGFPCLVKGDITAELLVEKVKEVAKTHELPLQGSHGRREELH